jgi:xylose isomerase
LWHFASYVDRYANDVPYPFTEGVTVGQVKAALAEHGLPAIGTACCGR